MSGRVNKPSEVQAGQVTKHWLRHKRQIPCLTPEVDWYDRWDDKTEKNFQGNEESEKELK